MADRLQRERDAFEAFARREGWTDAQLMRDERGYYFDPNVRAMWLGWAGRAADESGVSPCRAQQTGPNSWSCDCFHMRPDCKPNLAAGVRGPDAAEVDQGVANVYAAMGWKHEVAPGVMVGAEPDLPSLRWEGHQVWGDFTSIEAVRKAVRAAGVKGPDQC